MLYNSKDNCVRGVEGQQGIWAFEKYKIENGEGEGEGEEPPAGIVEKLVVYRQRQSKTRITWMPPLSYSAFANRAHALKHKAHRG